MQFENRRTAGHALGAALLHHVGTGAIVLGLPRGGIPVADEVAHTLCAPLDIWVVRKIGVPLQPELGMGAVAEGPSLYLDRQLIRTLGLGDDVVAEAVRREVDEIDRRVQRLRGGAPAPDVRGRTAILVDDGIAMGGTMRAAIAAVRKAGAARVVVAVPVASPAVLDSMRRDVDELICLHRPRELRAIGAWYIDFAQVSDQEVIRLLEEARARQTIPAPAAAAPASG